MKKIKLITTLIISFFTGMSIVNANPTASLTVNKTSIEVGQSVNATVNINAAAWNIKVESAGSTDGCSLREVGDSGNGQNTNKTFTVTCKSSSTGIINFTLTGDITGADLTNKNISASQSVTVRALSPTTTKSSDNNLSSLAIEGFELTPKFAASITNYDVEVAQGSTSVKINAKAANNTAKVSGIGEIAVEEGENRLEVVVTAANGTKKTYIINVFVPQKDPIDKVFNGETLSILRKLPEEKPLYFEVKTITINEEEIECLYNELLDMTLVYVRNEDGEYAYYIFENEEIIEIYKTIESDNIIIIISNVTEALKNMTLVDLTVDGQIIKAMQTRINNQFYIVKGINILTGKENLYYYDHINSTLSLFDEEGYDNTSSSIPNNDIMYITYGLASGIVILLLVIIFMSLEKRKLRQLIETMKERTMKMEPIKNKEEPLEKQEEKSNKKKKTKGDTK